MSTAMSETAKKRIVVLYGGRADEHPISCISTSDVLNAIDESKFDVLPVGITRDGEWIVDGTDPRTFTLNGSEMPNVDFIDGARKVLLDVSQGTEGFCALNADGTVESLGHVDAVFPVLHGPFGEDGTVQGLLEMMNIPYVGCGVFASSACMDKHFTKVLLVSAGIPVSPGFTLDMRDEIETDSFEQKAHEVAKRIITEGITYPVFVKPSRAGSSFGVVKVEAAVDETAQINTLASALREASEHDWRVLVEQGIDAREIECAVLAPKAGEKPCTSWPGEIVLDTPDDSEFYDFESKYVDSQASHVEVPANLPEETLRKVQEVAAKAFAAVDGAGLSRVDTFVTPEGEIIVNEINTMPGFTPISMYSKAWEATGVSYQQLLTELIEGVL